MKAQRPKATTGYFTKLIRTYNWPPEFNSKFRSQKEQWRIINAEASQERRLVTGYLAQKSADRAG